MTAMARAPSKRLVAAALILAALAVYAGLLLWPFHWDGASFGNGAEAMPGGGVRFQRPGIAVAREPLDWLQQAAAARALTLALRFRSEVAEQTGPARLFTLSKDAFERNLTVAQDGRDLVLRLRLPGADQNGLVDNRPVARIPEVFPTAGWVDLSVSIAPGTLRLALAGETLLEESFQGSALDGWDLAYDLALGNELTYDRPWRGAIQTARVQTGDLAIDYAQADRLTLPSAIVITTKPPKLTPFKDLNPQDAFLNLLLFAPFGILLGMLINRGTPDAGGWARWRPALGALLLMAAASAGFEALQILVPRRAPSIDDLIFNVIGGGLALVAAMISGRRFRCPDRNASAAESALEHFSMTWNRHRPAPPPDHPV